MCLNRGGKEGPQAADQEAGWEQPQLWWWGALQSAGSVDWLHSSCPLTTGSSHCCVLHLSRSVSLQGLAASLLSFCHYWVQQWLCPSFFCVSLQGLAASLFLFFSHYWVQPLLSFISLCVTAWFNCFTLLVLSLLLCPSFLCVSLHGLTISLFLSFSYYWVQLLLCPFSRSLSLSLGITAEFYCFTLHVFLSLTGSSNCCILPFTLSLRSLAASLFLSYHSLRRSESWSMRKQAWGWLGTCMHTRLCTFDSSSKYFTGDRFRPWSLFVF